MMVRLQNRRDVSEDKLNPPILNLNSLVTSSTCSSSVVSKSISKVPTPWE